MKTLKATATLVDGEGKPRPGVALALEVFRLAGGWTRLAEAAVGAAGAAALVGKLAVAERGAAPAARLVAIDGDTATPLAEGGTASYDAEAGQLTIDFGEVAVPAARDMPAIGLAPLRDTIGRIDKPILVERPLDLRQDLDRLRRERDEKDVALVQRDSELRRVRADLDLERSRREAAERLAQTGETEAIRVVRIERDRLHVEKEELGRRFQERESALEQATKRQEQLERLAADKVKETEALLAEKRLVVPIGDIAANLGKQVNAARATLADAPGVMKIAAVRFRVRGKLGEKGEGMLLPGLDAVGAGDGLDEMDFDLDAGDSPADPQVTVPDVTRLTESAARQVLASLGLRIDAATMPAASGFAIGQAMRQAPAAGQATGRGATVIVVFAA